ncbi:CocE/NonD family hydrolase [Salinibacterium sp. G-O1]|uniref:alpha/beta hydrolase family protein n=1 Tax=Salinibacterium sp. G-O1 TaxID=3046208 RepID=UPI0024BB9539|nr:CocE/NonD family hydrolase [Salinibacterium sp. G-O1]MDJ0336163.1 CocE/NonD family hydrolase [Salinibacterium sp. G-O1]
MKPALYKKNKFWLALSLVLVLLSAVGASLVQTSAYTITVKDMSWETSTGESLSALLYKPNGVSADNPAPAIIVSHGWWNNKEMQDANFVELARRGYVVVSIDMYGHGDSDYLVNSDITAGGTGMYDAVKLVANLPYVEQDKIGVSGHSNGARAANFSIPLDDAADKPLIAAVLLVDNDGVYTDADGAYTNVYGTRDVGIVADQYDEFFFRSYSPEGAVLTPPREYIDTPNAQSFLNFGAEGTETREAGTFYDDKVDGKDAFRVVYTPAETHPWGTISKTTVASQIEFFNEAFGAPNPIASGSQIWQVKEAFTTLGIIGFWIFVLAFARAMLHTRAFAGLRIAEPRAIVANTRKGLTWFWGGLVVLAFISGASWVLMSQTPWIQGIAFNATPTIFTQGAVFFVALWALINAVAVAIVLAVSYFAYGRKNGMDLRAAGLLPGWRTFFHGIGLAAVVVAASFSLVFIVDYFFKTDFRFWVIAIKAFGPDKLWIALLYVPFFLAYFVASSVAVNVFNRFTIRGKEWGNTAAIALFTALAAIVLVIVQYMTFFITGQTIPGFGGIFSIWLFPVILILILTVVISRKLYRVTGNPYIAGFINAAIVTIISVTNTLTVTY